MKHETEETPSTSRGKCGPARAALISSCTASFSQEYAVHVAGMPAAVATCRTLEDALAMADAMDRDCEEGALPGRGRY